MSEIDPDHLTVDDLVAQGVTAASAACDHCGAAWRAPIDFLPKKFAFRSIAALMICPSCGKRDISVKPAWRDDIAPQSN